MQISQSEQASHLIGACSSLDGGDSAAVRSIERRTNVERRKLSLLAHMNTRSDRHRRRSSRRECDRYNSYVDWYGPTLFLVVLALLLLSIIDATLTLYLLSQGAVELNPVMDWLIRFNPQLFVVVKLGLTGVGAVVLLGHFNFRIFRKVRVIYCLYFSLFAYVVLTSYETLLISRLGNIAV